MKQKSSYDINNYNIKITKNQNRKLMLIIFFLIIVYIVFRKNGLIGKISIFLFIISILLLISHNIVISFFGSVILFLLVDLIIKYKNTFENFKNIKNTIEKFESGDDTKNTVNTMNTKDSEPPFDTNIFQNNDFKKSSDGLMDLLKKANGGIELKDEDLQDTEILNIDLKKYNDDKKPNALKDAQKETYELINTVNALKDTITSLAPVLQEGKKLMNIFENLKM
jgi:energy-coupling factor transporter transmembrane protein EcfT